MNGVLDSLASAPKVGAPGAAPAGAPGQTAAETSDRFLRLLVAQMQNQDPLNPMDNAQVTTQMAQINTVSGIEKLNDTVSGLNAQFVQMQALQGATLVGRDVTVAGDRLYISDGVGSGGIDLAGAADRVKVDILNGGGAVVQTLELGALSPGRIGFDWPAGTVADGAGHRFRVQATLGTSAVPASTLMRDRVESVTAGGNTLQLQLQRSGSVTYTDILAFN